jgi:hypothetical protein
MTIASEASTVPTGEPAFLPFWTRLCAGGRALSRVRSAAPTARALDRIRPPAKKDLLFKKERKALGRNTGAGTLIAAGLRHREVLPMLPVAQPPAHLIFYRKPEGAVPSGPRLGGGSRQADSIEASLRSVPGSVR